MTFNILSSSSYIPEDHLFFSSFNIDRILYAYHAPSNILGVYVPLVHKRELSLTTCVMKVVCQNLELYLLSIDCLYILINLHKIK